VEGAYYVWNRDKLTAILEGDDLALFDTVFALADLPAFPGHRHPDGGALFMRKPIAVLAADLGIPYAALHARVDDILAQLKDARVERKLPRLDDKVIAGWNGLMIGAYAEAGRVLDKPAYTEAARRAAAFLLEHMRDDDGNLPKAAYKLVGFGSYLRAILFEDRPLSIDQAEREYRRLAKLEPAYPFAEEDIERNAAGYFAAPGNGVVHVLALVGRGSFRVETNEPVSEEALLIAQFMLAFFQGRPVIPNLQSIRIPALAFHDGNPTEVLIEVNGRDRPRLLSDVAQALFELNLSISSAHIETYGERAVDVFYVNDLFGLKITNEGKLAKIKDGLLAAVAEPKTKKTGDKPVKAKKPRKKSKPNQAVNAR